MTPVAIYHGQIPDKFGLPRQSGVVPALRGEVRLEPAFRDPSALRGLEGFDYIWLLWGFSANRDAQWRPTVRPPRLGGNERVGVFATRSPYHPNAIGLSSVRLAAVDAEKGILTVLGADLMDGTPIYDIKPYIPYTDAHPDARSGFVDATQWHPLAVELPEAVRQQMSAEDIPALIGILSQDPRPRYQDDPEKVYGMRFADRDIHFRVREGILSVISSEPARPEPSE